MGKSKRRQAMFARKRVQKEQRMKKPGARSPYAKKKDFLRNNGGWGFDYPSKPWKQVSIGACTYKQTPYQLEVHHVTPCM